MTLIADGAATVAAGFTSFLVAIVAAGCDTTVETVAATVAVGWAILLATVTLGCNFVDSLIVTAICDF